MSPVAMLRTFLLFAILIFGVKVLAHARIVPNASLAPRNNNAGLKIGPCGNVARTATPRILQAGSTITVNWEETINHPGRFEFYFSPANDLGFTLLKTVVDTQDQTNNLPHQYNTTLTVPATNCSSCTIQMIQVMTENPANPSLYYSCADIVIQGGTPETMGPSPAPPPTPTPTPGDHCAGN